MRHKLALMFALAACHTTPENFADSADGSGESTTHGAATSTDTDEPEPEPLACSEGQPGQATVEFLNPPQNPDIDTTCMVLEIVDDGFLLDCDKPQPEPFEFVYDLEPDLEPDRVTEALPFALGQTVSLRVAFGSGAWSFAIRDARGQPLIIDYELWPSAAGELNGEFELPTIAPLDVQVIDGLCTTHCSEDEGFLPTFCLCHRGLGLEFSSSGAPLLLTAGHTGLLRGQANGRVYVRDAWVCDDFPMAELDVHGALRWTFVTTGS